MRFILLTLLSVTTITTAGHAPKRTSPFDAIFIADDGTITVTVGDLQGTLVSVAAVSPLELFDHADERDPAAIKKRIAEDIGDVIERAKGRRPDATVEVVLDTPGGRRTVDATFTRQKRQLICNSDYGNGRYPAERDRCLHPKFARALLRMTAAYMETRWSYRHLHPTTDVESELLATLPDGEVTFGDVAVGTARVLGMFPDGHSGVDNFDEHAGDRYLPAMVFLMGEGRVAVMQSGENDTGRPLDTDRPFASAIDGRPTADWLAAARTFEPTSQSGSDWHVAETLRYVPLLRRELGLPERDDVTITLVDAEGGDPREVTLRLADRRPSGRPRGWMTPEGYHPFPVPEIELPDDMPPAQATLFTEMFAARARSDGGSATLPNGIGYLRLASMGDSSATLAAIVQAMESFREAPGLVIDVRGNGGGSRLPLLTLWRYIKGEGEAPRVVTLAKPILDADESAYQELSGSRFMYPADWRHWSDGEGDAIAAFIAGFEPSWSPGEGRGAFGEWHYLVLGGDLNDDALRDQPDPYYFDKPIVVLMDGDCFSATSIFLAAMAQRDNVRLVGTPAPAGSGFRVKHRISEVPDFELSLSSMVSFMPDGRIFDGNLISPDVEVWPTLDNLAGKGDAQLDAAIAVYPR